MKYTNAQQQRSIEALKRHAPAGSTVWYTVESVARSGRSRRMRFFTFGEGVPAYLTYHVAVVLGLAYQNAGATIRVSGCGMDMGFNTVYVLSRALYGDGRALEARQL